jgi:lipopolysaccharide transport system permease protein
MSESEYQLVIEAGRTEKHYWKDIWRYRELFYFLAWRDILVRYKQTVLGILWAVIRPLLTMVVFTFLFGKIGKFPSNNVPYAILVFVGLLPWQFFSSGFSDASTSLIGNANMISKVYFPRFIIPTSSIMVSFVDFLISFILMTGLMIYYHVTPSTHIIYLPVFMLLAILATMGAGLWVAALNVKYRDFRYIVPFVVQFGLYISPVGISTSVISEKWKLLYSINPMVGIIDGFRWSILGQESTIYLPGFILSLCIIVILLVTGIIIFERPKNRLPI